MLSPTGHFNPANASSPRGSAKSSTRSEGNTGILSGPGGKVRILTLNANSVKGKPAELADTFDYVKPLVSAISETKIDKSVYTSEFLPKNYLNALRNDRNINGGGVLLTHVDGC